MKRLTKYVGKDATVILDSKGRIVTVWANSEMGFRTPGSLEERLKRISKAELSILTECLKKHDSSLLDKVALVDSEVLEDSTINRMREAVGTELLNEGFESNGNPNEYGLKLEEIIDNLSHYWESQRKQFKRRGT